MRSFSIRIAFIIPKMHMKINWTKYYSHIILGSEIEVIPMRLSELLQIKPGVTAVIGSGGKTSLLAALARELDGTVILCTTTHILPFPELPFLDAPTPSDLQRRRVICVGTPQADGKLTAPTCTIATLRALADYVLVEADGSRQLPLKAHAPHEPVIPPETAQTICVVGASGFGRPICDVVHRPELFCRLTGADPHDPVTPALAAHAVAAEALCDRVFVNQLDAPSDWLSAAALASTLPIPVAGGSLRTGRYSFFSDTNSSKNR